MNIQSIYPEVYRENRKHLSVTVHSDIMKLMRKIAKKERWSLSRTTDELLLRGLKSVGYLPEEQLSGLDRIRAIYPRTYLDYENINFWELFQNEENDGSEKNLGSRQTMPILEPTSAEDDRFTKALRLQYSDFLSAWVDRWVDKRKRSIIEALGYSS